MIGTDIIEIHRIRHLIEQYNNTFLDKIFTPDEQAYCNDANLQKYARYAARFAAKEAVAKALSTGIRGFWFTDIEIINQASGKPTVQLKGRALTIANMANILSIEISLSHCKEYAIAVAVATTTH